jgi:UDP-N-acetylmuramoyl-L-alanyl-D-glutamate--2,6-diaminopimelate ligase
VMNALQAAAVAHVLGVDADALQSALASCIAPPGRLEPVTTSHDPFAVYVDYAHTDDALEHVLRTLRPLVPAGGRLHVVFGCGGDRDRSKRARMAAVACRYADEVVVTSDNPRTENPQRILDDIRAGVPSERLDDTVFVLDRAEAIETAIAGARDGDVVLVAGKGHEDYQIIGETKHPFDDRLVVAAVLQRLCQRVAAP